MAKSRETNADVFIQTSLRCAFLEVTFLGGGPPPPAPLWCESRYANPRDYARSSLSSAGAPRDCIIKSAATAADTAIPEFEWALAKPQFSIPPDPARGGEGEGRSSLSPTLLGIHNTPGDFRLITEFH